MPRSLQEVLDHADQLAASFEDDDPTGEAKDARTLRELRAAVLARADAEQAVDGAVAAARGDGQTWSAIGAMLGTSGEAARQRYAHRVSDADQSATSTPDDVVPATPKPARTRTRTTR